MASQHADDVEAPPTPLDAVARISTSAAMSIATLVMMGLLLMIVVNAALRTLSGSVIPGAYEFGQVAMPILVFLALPWTFLNKNNYQLDLFYAKFTETGQRVVDVVHTTLYLVVTAIWTYGTFLAMTRSLSILDYIPGAVRVPVYPSRVAIAVGCVLVLIVLIRELWQNISLIRHSGPGRFETGAN